MRNVDLGERTSFAVGEIVPVCGFFCLCSCVLVVWCVEELNVFWTLLPVFLDAQDRQQTQYQVFSQVKMEDALALLTLPTSECPDFWIRLPRHTWPKSWGNIEEPVVRLKRDLYGPHLAGWIWKRQLEKVLPENGWERAPTRQCLFVHRQQGLFLSVHEDDIKMIGKKQCLEPMWERLMKLADLEKPTSFLSPVCQKSQQKIVAESCKRHRTHWIGKDSSIVLLGLRCKVDSALRSPTVLSPVSGNMAGSTTRPPLPSTSFERPWYLSPQKGQFEKVILEKGSTSK